ncbi:MAG: UDP-3-O-acylglucosamine N-acyltransferase [Verrucomicrobiales bacterium]|nr:UDP-3-O-acylglucosamine N-acyltransferase [Verrucomicrobiales bacterium]
MPISAADLAAQIQGTVIGDSTLILQRVAEAKNAIEGDLTFAQNERFFQACLQSAASAIIVDDRCGALEGSKTLIKVASARIGYARALPLFFPEPEFLAGIHPSAVIHPTAKVDATAHIGPFCAVEAGAQIGARVVLQSHISIGVDAVVGEDSRFFPNVSVYPRSQIGKRVRIHCGAVVGSDGYGYVFDKSFHRKVPQVGIVFVGDDVEIGANVTIDRGALGPTIIGKGTKIDNLVQVAHNVLVGEHNLLIAQSGIAGSSKLGNYVTIAGQAGIAGHLSIGDRAVIAGQSGVSNDIEAGEKVLGSPAVPDRQAKRQFFATQRLPDLLKRVDALEKRLAELTKNGEVKDPDFEVEKVLEHEK